MKNNIFLGVPEIGSLLYNATWALKACHSKVSCGVTYDATWLFECYNSKYQKENTVFLPWYGSKGAHKSALPT